MFGQSARNRFTGIVTRVERDKLTAVVEIHVGPHRLVSLMTREAADELGLKPGDLATAAVKSTNVVVEVPRRAQPDGARPAPRASADRRAPRPSSLTAGLRLVASVEPAARRPPRDARAPLTGGRSPCPAAASLTAAFTTIGDDFVAANPGSDVTFNFDSSGTLGTQIRAARPPTSSPRPTRPT